MLLLRGLFLKLDLEWKVKKTTQTPIAVRGIWAPVRGDPTDCFGRPFCCQSLRHISLVLRVAANSFLLALFLFCKLFLLLISLIHLLLHLLFHSVFHSGFAAAVTYFATLFTIHSHYFTTSFTYS